MLFWSRKKPVQDGKSNESMEYDLFARWLDHVLTQEIPDEVVAFCFNLYDDAGNNWSIELVGTDRFDREDDEWPCDEITDFGTREANFSWQQAADWNSVLKEAVAVLTRYLSQGAYADVLKSKAGVAVGFVDGDLHLL